MGRVFSREFWFSLLSHYGVASLAPQPSDQSFDEWWRKVDNSASGDLRKGLNSLVILGAWSIWRHRNDCVFNGATPNVIMIYDAGFGKGRDPLVEPGRSQGDLLAHCWRSSRKDCCSGRVVHLLLTGDLVSL